MSVEQIITELATLSEAELGSGRKRLVELAAKNQEVSLCDQSAIKGAEMLARMESADAERRRL